MTIDTTAIKEHVDLLDLIGRDTTLLKVAMTCGGEYAGPCPFCGGGGPLSRPARAGSVVVSGL